MPTNPDPNASLPVPARPGLRKAGFITGQYTTDSNSTGTVPLSTDRHLWNNITITNTGQTTVYVGTAGVGSQSGVPLASGAAMSIQSVDPDERVSIAEVFVTGSGTSGVVVAWWAVG